MIDDDRLLTKLFPVLAGGTEKGKTVAVKAAVWQYFWNRLSCRHICAEAQIQHRWRVDLMAVVNADNPRWSGVHLIEVKITAGDLRKDVCTPADANKWAADTRVDKELIDGLRRQADREARVRQGGVDGHRHSRRWSFNWTDDTDRAAIACLQQQCQHERTAWCRDPARIQAVEILDQAAVRVRRRRRPEVKFADPDFGTLADFLWLATPTGLVATADVPFGFGLLAVGDGVRRQIDAPRLDRRVDVDDRIDMAMQKIARANTQRLVQTAGEVHQGGMTWSMKEDG